MSHNDANGDGSYSKPGLDTSRDSVLAAWIGTLIHPGQPNAAKVFASPPALVCAAAAGMVVAD
jgi:hypothetical protein